MGFSCVANVCVLVHANMHVFVITVCVVVLSILGVRFQPGWILFLYWNTAKRPSPKGRFDVHPTQRQRPKKKTVRLVAGLRIQHTAVPRANANLVHL